MVCLEVYLLPSDWLDWWEVCLDRAVPSCDFLLPHVPTASSEGASLHSKQMF